MLWSTAIFVLFVGAPLATSQHGFKDAKEYTYKVQSRTLATINSLSKQFSGILTEAQLTIQLVSKDHLRGVISHPNYAQIHTRLENGWDSKISPSQINWQKLPLSRESFEIKTKNGVVRDLIVNKDTPTWEVNMLKAMISQLQVDLKGENSDKTEENKFAESEQPNRSFRVMEDSVGGKCEVLYDLSFLPQEMLKKNPEMAPLPQLQGDGKMISLIKTKNYSKCNQRISYHFGINGRNKWEPGSSDNGKYLSRSAVTQMVLSGSLKKFTIQSSVTTNNVILSPDQQDNQPGMINSKINLTLSEVTDILIKISAPSDPQSVGNLVYNYNNPYEKSSSRRPNKLNLRSKSQSDKTSDESSLDTSDSTSNEEEDSYLQLKPKLTEAPLNPMLSYFIGNQGNSILMDNKVNAVRSAISIAQEIGNDMKKLDSMSDEHTLEKFTILTRLIRTMNAEQIEVVQFSVFESKQSPNELLRDIPEKISRRNAWVAFRDAVSQAGTGPALVNIKKWIQNKQILGFEAAGVIDSMAKSTRTPTPEYMDAFFDLIKMEETKQETIVRDISILSFADLVRHAIVNKNSAHNRYPVHAFGKFFGRKSRNSFHKYLAYLTEELKSALDSGDSGKIQVHVVALGRTASPKVLPIFEPYIQGKNQISQYQRLLMIISLDQLATIHPKAAQSVLYKIYLNTTNAHEIRTAAVYLLMKTHPPASMIRRMADFTNHDTSKHVNSAVKSVIESLAELQGNEIRNVSEAARAALPLLTLENYGPQYSKAMFKNFKNPHTHTGMSIAAYYVGSDDSIVPRGVAIAVNPNIQGLKLPKIQLTSVVSSSRNIFEFIQKQLSDDVDKKLSEKEKGKKYSPESIAKLLGIHGFGVKQLEGFAVFNENTRNIFMSFDNSTLENLPRQLKRHHDEFTNGINIDEAEFNNYEVTLSFPTETGFPLTFTLKTPSVISIKGHAKADRKDNSETINGKMKVTIGVRVQKRISFATPFENHEYASGIDKDLQVFLPLKGEVKYNDKKEVSLKVQPDENEPEYKILQYKKQPFTSKHNVLSLRPMSSDKNTHIIHKSHAVSSQTELNDWSNKPSVKFIFERQSDHRTKNSGKKRRDNKRLSATTAAQKLARALFALVYPLNPEKSEEYEKYSVKITPKNDLSVELKLSYGSMTTGSDSDDNGDSLNAKAPSLDKKLSSSERKQKLLKDATEKINSAQGYALDAEFRMNIATLSSVTVTAAAAKSNVDPKSRALVCASIKSQGEEDWNIASTIEAKMPSVKSLDYEKTLNDTSEFLEFAAELRCGLNMVDEFLTNEFKIQGKFKQTEQRRNKIRESEDMQTCEKEVSRTGNRMSSACEKANERAYSVDAGEVTIALHKDLSAVQLAEDVVKFVEMITVTSADPQKDPEDKEEKNKIHVSIQLSSEDDEADVSVKSSEGKVNIKNIKLGNLGHEINSGSSSITAKENSNLSLMQPRTCSLDKTEVKTFDNYRYPVKIGKCWHVAMTSFPKTDPDQQNKSQDILDNMRVSILTRDSNDQHKELKITLGGKEIELKPSASPPQLVDAYIDGEKTEVHRRKSQQEKKNGQVTFEIFQLPDSSVKVVSDKYGVDVVYDGSRAEVEAGERYRNSIRGLCGNNDAESGNDQQTPKGCLLQKPEEFAASYALVQDEECQGAARENAEKAKKSECLLKNPASSGSDRESEEEIWDDEESKKQCMEHRTLIQRTDTQVCFSRRPVPACSSKCSPKETKSKKVDYHCVKKSETSEKIAGRVEKGAKLDIAHKSTTKTESQQVPVSCSA